MRICITEIRFKSGLYMCQVGEPLEGSPPFSWEESAIDALRLNDFVNWHDWSVGGMIVLFERNNGLGYRKRGLRSPYVWGCTNVYRGGAYVADGHFDPNARSHTVGPQRCYAGSSTWALCKQSQKQYPRNKNRWAKE